MSGFLKQITQGAKAGAEAIGEGAQRGSRAIGPAAVQAGTRQERVAATRAKIIGLSSGNLQDEIRRMTSDLDDVAPNLAGVAALKATKGIQYLASKAPPIYQPPYSNRPPMIDPVAVAEFERRVEAVTDPTRSLARLADGTFTREHAEALRETSPALYATAQRQVMDALGEAQTNGTAIPQRTLTQLSFLGIPADPTLAMAPAIAMSLSSPVTPPPPGATPPSPKPAKKIEIDTDRTATATSKVGTME